MLDLLRSERPDLVQVHNTFMMVSPSVFEACREAGIPAVQTLNNYKLLCPGWSLCREGRFVKNVSSRDCGERNGTLLRYATGEPQFAAPAHYNRASIPRGRASDWSYAAETEPAYRAHFLL